MNCGAMGLDWERLSLSGYLEAMVAQSGEGPKAEPTVTDAARLRMFRKARGAMGNA